MRFQRTRKPLLLLVLIALGFACTPWDNGWQDPPEDVKGFKPVYISRAAAFSVSVDAAQPLVKPGKIYIYYGHLFIVERLKGIHVYNNQDPSNPLPVAFINVPGCNDVAVSSGILYADNVTDLVAFDVSDPQNISFKKRLAGQLPAGSQLFPEQADNNYFECVDTTKGVVVDWEFTTLKNPKCYR